MINNILSPVNVTTPCQRTCRTSPGGLYWPLGSSGLFLRALSLPTPCSEAAEYRERSALTSCGSPGGVGNWPMHRKSLSMQCSAYLYIAWCRLGCPSRCQQEPLGRVRRERMSNITSAGTGPDEPSGQHRGSGDTASLPGTPLLARVSTRTLSLSVRRVCRHLLHLGTIHEPCRAHARRWRMGERFLTDGRRLAGPRSLVSRIREPVSCSG